MKILHTVFANGWGGLEKYPLTLKNGLEKKGNILIILTIKGSKLHIEAEKLGVKVYTIDRFKKISFKIIKLLDRIVKEEKIDIVHLNTSRELYNWYFVLKRYKYLKCFLTFHIGIPKNKFFFHKIIYKRLTNIFVISTRDMRVIKNNIPIDYSKVVLNYNGVELNYFNTSIKSNFREEIQAKNDTIIISSIGNLSRAKGVIEWLEVSKKISNKFKNIIFVWAGDDKHIKEKYSLDSLREDIIKNKLESQIKLLGYRNDIANILKGTDIFLLPSHNEPFGIVYIEAMAMGLPVIGCNAGGVPDIIKKENGWLCEPKDIVGLEKVLLEAISLEEKLSEFKIINKESVKNFSMEIHLEKLLEIYEK